MAVSRVRAVSVPWDSQPQEIVAVDRSTPANQAITTLIPCGALMLDLVTGVPLTIGAGGASAPTPFGSALVGSGSAARASIPIDLSYTNVISISFWYYVSANTLNDNLGFEFGPNWNSNNGGFGFDPNWGAQPTNAYFALGQASGGIGATLFTRPAVGWHHFAAILDRTVAAAIGGLLLLFIDGKSVARTSKSNSGSVTGNFAKETLYLLSRSGTSLLDAGPIFNLVIRAGYRITEAEANYEYQNPWQLFEPQQILIPMAITATADFSAAGAGGITFAGAADAVFDAGFAVSGSGGMVFGGAAATTFTADFAHTPTGGLVLGGLATASNTADFAQAGAGGLTFSGAAGTLLEVGYTHTASGGLQLAGAAGVAYTFDYAHSASGGLILAGAASSSFTANFSQVASGGLLFSGVATTSYTSSDYAYSGTGGLTFGGAALTIGPPVPVTLDLSGGGGARRGPHADEAANRRIKAMRDQEIHARNQQIIQAIVAMVTSGALDDMTVE